jgi:hypothetical protein
VATEVLDLALLQAGEKAIVDAYDGLWVQLCIPEKARQRPSEFAALVLVGLF